MKKRTLLTFLCCALSANTAFAECNRETKDIFFAAKEKKMNEMLEDYDIIYSAQITEIRFDENSTTEGIASFKLVEPVKGSPQFSELRFTLYDDLTISEGEQFVVLNWIGDELYYDKYKKEEIELEPCSIEQLTTLTDQVNPMNLEDFVSLRNYLY